MVGGLAIGADVLIAGVDDGLAGRELFAGFDGQAGLVGVTRGGAVHAGDKDLAQGVGVGAIDDEGKAKKPSLPKALPDQVAAIRAILAESEAAISSVELAARFRQSKTTKARIEDLLETLAMLGQADEIDGRYVLNE